MTDTVFHDYAIKHDCDEHQGMAISDYHALTKQEIAELLQRAQEACRYSDVQASFRTRASIQLRLQQGIVGHHCPHPIEGPAAEARYKLGELFVSRKGHYTDFDLVDELYAIMHHQESSTNA